MHSTLPNSDRIDRMRTVHTHVQALLSRLTALTVEMWPLLEPKWPDVQSVFQSLATAWSALEDQDEELELFAGLRPDGVLIAGITYPSWHHGAARLASVIYQLLNVRWGLKTDAEGTTWCHAASVNWLSETLDLPHTKKCRLGRRTRATAWELAVEDYSSENTIIPKAGKPYDLTVSGWASLRELDIRTLETNIKVELDYATREAGSAAKGGTSTEQNPTPSRNQTTAEHDARLRSRREPPDLAPIGPDEVSVREAAKLLGEGKDKVLTRILSGDLPARNIARPGKKAQYRIRKEDLIAIRNAYTTATPPDKPRREPKGRWSKPGGAKQHKHIKLGEN